MSTGIKGEAPLGQRLQQREADERLSALLVRAEHAERELADSQAYHRSLIDALAEGVVTQDRHGNILVCNAAAERILGLSQDQMRGRTSLDPRWRAVREDGSTFPGEQHPAMLTLRTNQPVRGALMGVNKPDDSMSWISVNTQPVDLSDGSRAVVASFTDVTGLRNALTDFERSESLFRLALNAARVGVWEWDIEADDITWTEEVYKIFGVPSGAPINFSAYLHRIHAKDRPLVERAIRTALAPGSGDAYEIDHRVSADDGSTRWVRGRGQVIRSTAGTPLKMRGAVSDITAAKALEARGLRSQRMESIGRLAGGIAHDFNNLITGLLGAVEEGQANVGNAAQVAVSFQTIDTACRHATQLTRQLLAFARQQVLEFESCNLDALIQDTSGLLKHLLNEDIELTVEPGAGDWNVRLDATQMQQVLVNLAANARDAMPDGGVFAIRIRRVPAGSHELSLEDAGNDWLSVEVSDNGVGMAPEVTEHVFEPFFSTKPTGTGLGLSTCYGIVQQCGGRIECHSTPGAGTLFAIQLPRAPSETGAASKDSSGSDSSEQARGATVLVVEDQEQVLRVTERALTRSGFTVLATGSSEEALMLLATREDVEVLLSDVVMPKIGGLELARRARERRPNLKIVFMSGYAGGPLIEQLRELGGVATLEKPFRPSDLVARVRQVLETG